MRNFIIGIMVLSLLGAAGFFGFRYVSRQNNAPESSESKTTTVSGMLLPGKGDDYSFVLFTNGKTIGITSQTIQLGDYANKKVEITGSYSGTTLYAYTVNEIR